MSRVGVASYTKILLVTCPLAGGGVAAATEIPGQHDDLTGSRQSDGLPAKGSFALCGGRAGAPRPAPGQAEAA